MVIPTKNLPSLAPLTVWKVPFEILPEKRHIAWVLAVFQMGPNVLCYHTSPEEVLDQIGQYILLVNIWQLV